MLLRCALTAFLAGLAALAQTSYYLPEVIDGPVAGGATARTAILLVNSGSVDASTTLQFTGDAAALAGAVTVTAGTSIVLRSDGSGLGAGGSAIISSTAPLVVTEVVTLYNNSGNILTESAAADASVVSSFIVPVDTTGALDTGTALYNPGLAPASITFQLVDPTGAPVEQATAVLAAGASVARWIIADLYTDIASGFQGTLVVSSTSPLRAMALRQNGSAPSLTLLPVTAASSSRTRYFVPQVANGAFGAVTVQSSFLIYNLSSIPANVSLTLAHDDGSPFTVNIPATGLAASNSFTMPLAPGASTILETDGQGTSASGSAMVTADQPIGIAVVVTRSSSTGTFLTENVATTTSGWQLWTAPVEITGSLDNVVAMFNPGSQPVTVTASLFDPTGAPINTASVPPIAPGGRAAISLTQLFGLAGPFTGTVTLATPLLTPGVVAALLRQDLNSDRFASQPMAIQPIPAQPLTITTQLDSAHAATAIISAVNGGTLTATGADNNSYTLTIPPNALTNDLAITITPLSASSGLPISGGVLSAGVQFAPEGLALIQPATLVITPASPLPSGSLIVPVGWTGAGDDATLAPVVVDPSQVAISIMHFSGAGIGGGAGISPGDAGAIANGYGNEADVYQNQISQILNDERQSEADGTPGDPDWQEEVQNLLQQYYEQVIDPLLQIAIESGDPTLLNCAIQKAVNWEKQRELAGTGSTIQDSPAYPNILKAAQAVVNLMKQRCDQKDPTAAPLLISAWRSYALLSNDTSGQSDIVDEIQKCAPTYELDFDSAISGGGPANGTFNAVVTAKVSLTLGLSANPATPNLMIGGGSGQLSYTAFSASPALPLAPCTQSGSPATGSTFNVYQTEGPLVSGIYYDVNLTTGANQSGVGADGKSSFCQSVPPQATPIAVNMLIDPGMPTDGIEVSCSAGSETLLTNFWVSKFELFHQMEIISPGFNIQNWQIAGGDVYAEKDYSNTMPAVNASFTESTTLVLKHVTAPPQN
ncbi:MAG TPA: hypothetical protein VGL53_17770 [Bryobacteraceae bacterium]|jgi:hypothetical protein